MSTSSTLTLAEHYLNINQPARALDLLSQPENAHLNSPHFWFLHGEALFKLDQFEAARASILKGLALAPDDPLLLFVLCNCEDKAGSLAAAENAILAAIRQQPHDPHLICRYAKLVAQTNQMDKAHKLVAMAAQIDPNHRSVRHLQISLAYVTENVAQTIAKCQDALTLFPEDPYILYILGHSYAERGKPGHAANFLRRAAQINPLNHAFTTSARRYAPVDRWWLTPVWPFRRVLTHMDQLIFPVIILMVILWASGQYNGALSVCMGWLVILYYTAFMNWIMRHRRKK
ncbi:MAG: tetratricopeptide repeat protein [Anaerolineae bacterium]|nr:tetratricopeptide repeat protein [Anaerolineae bacterium]